MNISVLFATFVSLSSSAAVAQTGGPSFTAEQAQRGEAAYQHACRTCHGDNLDDGDFGGAPLKGSWFRNHWGVGDVAGLFAYTKTYMPPDNPGGLNDSVYAAIVAFILQKNGYAAGERELPVNPLEQRAMSLKR